MRVLGLDLGSKRIGLAVSDEDGQFAFPSGALHRKGLKKDLEALRELAAERHVARIVVGLPLHMSGRSGEGAQAARAFAEALAEATGLPVDTLDERWTSREAERALRDGSGGWDGSGGRRRREKARREGAVDAAAAALILRTYLDRGVPTEPQERPR